MINTLKLRHAKPSQKCAGCDNQSKASLMSKRPNRVEARLGNIGGTGEIENGYGVEDVNAARDAT